jgi:O-antigen ligase
VWVSGGLLAVAIVFGGGGTPSPTTELIVELAALAGIVAWVWLAANDRSYSAGDIDRPLYVIAALFVAVPVLQLIPLPPAIWHNLPGREVEIRALTLVGRDNAWMPWSLSPARTIASALSLIPPIAMLFMVSRLRERDRVRLIGSVAALGLLAAVVGVFQLAGGNANWLRFYAITQYGFATGFQANRNADADVLLIAAIALVAWAVIDGRVRQSRQMQLVIAALLLFLALSVVLTGSRAGVALLSIVIVASVVMIIRLALTKNWRLVAAAALGVAGVASAAYFLSENARVQRTLGRFDNGDAVRPEIWKDTIYSIGQHWPAGSGVGTFRPIFTAAERLEFVRPDFSNRAHNDYLEFLLEAGVIAPIILVLALAFASIRLWRMLTSKEKGCPHTIGILVLGSLLVLLFHSLVDYPERSLSLAVVSGLLGGLLGRSGVGEGRRSEVLREL